MKMETKENDDVQEDCSTPASPIAVLQKLSEEAFRRAGEALHGAYSGSPIFKTPPQLDPAPRHRRARSEVVALFHRRSGSGSTSSFQKWKCQMRKALHWNSSSSREGSQFPSFDPEILANQKRQWYQLQSKTLVCSLVTSNSEKLNYIFFHYFKGNRSKVYFRNSISHLFLLLICLDRFYEVIDLPDFILILANYFLVDFQATTSKLTNVMALIFLFSH